MNSVIGILSIVVMTILSTAAVTAASGTGVDDAARQAPGDVSGVTLYGAYLMRHTVHEDGSATAHFSPALPLDQRLLTGAMQSLARIAYNQQAIDAKAIDTFKPVIGAVIKLQDPDYEYRFVLDGSPTKGISAILVRRNAIAHPSDDAALLKELEKL